MVLMKKAPMQRSRKEIVKHAGIYLVLPPFQIIRHPKNLGESKQSKFDQDYREKNKDYDIKLM